MARIPTELLENLGEDYRIVEFDGKGLPKLLPGEVLMVRSGVYIGYMGNVDPKYKMFKNQK